jgi:hypothetical protein
MATQWEWRDSGYKPMATCQWSQDHDTDNHDVLGALNLEKMQTSLK